MSHSSSLSTSFNKRFLAICAVALVTLPHFADVISPATALDIARQYVQVKAQDKQRIKTLSAHHNRKPRNSKPAPYYLFNDAKGQGFVLVAGDNAMGEVLAYSDQHNLDITALNPGARYLLEAYQQTFTALQQHAPQMQRTYTTSAAADKVLPLLKTQWNQDFPYNLQLGPDLNSPYPYSGCVATAVAQIMAFHKWPEKGVGKAAYTVTHYQDRLSADFSKSQYDWHLMRDEYRSKSTPEQQQAVALLMKDVGIATQMQYTPWYSGTLSWNAKEALQEHFQYDVAILSKSAEGTHFAQIVHKEISNGYPVYLSGFQTAGKNGHAWVADGYDEKGLTHMNFGWGGSADGYYSINAINVQNSGAEFNGQALSFSKGMEAILIHPLKNGTSTLPTEFKKSSPKLTGNEGTEFRLVNSQSKIQPQQQPLQVSLQYIYNSGASFEGKVGLVIYSEQQQMVKDPVYNATMLSLPNSGLYQAPLTFNLDVNQLPDGRYSIVPICQPSAQANSTQFFPIRKMPNLALKIEAGKAHILREFYTGAGYEWDGKPVSATPLRAGESTKLLCPIHILQAAYKRSTLKLSLLNADNVVVYTAQTHPDEVEMSDFQTSQIALNIDLPSDFTPGTYKVKAQMLWAKDALIQQYEDLWLDVQEADNHTTTTLEVKPPLQTSQLLVLRTAFLDGSGEAYAQNQIPMNQNFTFALSVKNKSNAPFKGKLKCYFEEQATGVRIPLVSNFLDNTSINGNQVRLLQSGWLKNDKLTVNNNKPYTLVVVQQLENGDQIEVPFSVGISRTYWFKNSIYTPNSSETYVPQPKEFFTLKLPTKSTYVVAPSPENIEESSLSTSQLNDEATQLRAIFYREGDYIISLATGRMLQWNATEQDWNQVLTFAPEGQKGSPLHWVQQDAQIRPRGTNNSDLTLATPMIAERVNSLPITLAPHGMASFYTPVQGTIIGATAFRATINQDGQLELHKITGEIPANTAFLVKKDWAHHVHFQISLGKSPVPAFTTEENVLSGSVFTPQLATSAIVYALSGEEQAFYRLEALQRPFRAYIVRSTTLDYNPIFKINPTGIEAVTPLPIEHAPLYELSGRRIADPKSGQILIVGGQKVLY